LRPDRHQPHTLKIGERPFIITVLAVLVSLGMARTPQLQYISHRGPVCNLPPKLIPYSLARVPQEYPRPQLDQPTRQHAPPFPRKFLQDHHKH